MLESIPACCRSKARSAMASSLILHRQRRCRHRLQRRSEWLSRCRSTPASLPTTACAPAPGLGSPGCTDVSTTTDFSTCSSTAGAAVAAYTGWLAATPTGAIVDTPVCARYQASAKPRLRTCDNKDRVSVRLPLAQLRPEHWPLWTICISIHLAYCAQGTPSVLRRYCAHSHDRYGCQPPHRVWH